MKNSTLLLILFLLILSCNDDENKYPGTITGGASLTDNYYAQLFSGFDKHDGITVTLYDEYGFSSSTTTDIQGFYQIDNIKEGDYHLRFEKEGFTKYEIFDIHHNGLDTLNFGFDTSAGKKVRLEPINRVELFKILEDPYIHYYKGSLDFGPYKGSGICGKNFQIVTEVYSTSGEFSCIAFIDDNENVDNENYKLAVYTGTSSRTSISHLFLPIGFYSIDREVFPEGTNLYIRFYPCNSDLSGYDPWIGKERYFMIDETNSKLVSFKLPHDEYYYVGLPGCDF